MSHELRTPLNAILGFSQLLELDVLTTKQRESVGHIVGGGQQLLELIDEVLDIARIESGSLDMALEAVAIQDLVHETIALIEPIATAHQVEICVREGLGPPAGAASGPYVTADRQRLRQVLLNLLSNAIKFNEAGGRVTLSYEIATGGLRLRISDTGPGIPREKRARMFTPFDRLGAELGGVGGTGLGLTLSKRLMEAMSGNLGLEDNPASTGGLSDLRPGAVFWIDLPLATSAPAAPAETTAAAVNPLPVEPLPSGRTLLYIEDNLSNLRLVECLLERHPEVRLLTAIQGKLGLELARKHQPDVILLDVHLPDVPGWNVLAQLRADANTRHIPVVVISADAMEPQIRRLREAGAYDYLTKPLNLRKFLGVLREVLVKPTAP
jgi:CheY-like chemotaxis protein